MLSLEALYRLPVFEPRAARRTKGADAREAPAQRRLGRVHFPVFSPDGRRLVGLLVKRPDVAGMVKREDVFCAWDRLSPVDRGLLVSGEAATDAEAIGRLGLDWDRCIIWSGMDVATLGGKELGRVADLEVAPDGAVERVLVSDGDWAETFVGAVPLTMDLVRGVRDHTMIVADEVDDIELTGGLMAAAGRGFGTAKVKAGEALEKAGATAGTVLDRGSFALGRAIGKARDSIRGALADDGSEGVPAEAAEAEARPGPGAAAPEGEPSAEAEATGPEAPPDPEARPKPAGESRPERPAHPSTGDPVADAAQAFGRQLGKTQGMFKAFLREFKENSK